MKINLSSFSVGLGIVGLGAMLVLGMFGGVVRAADSTEPLPEHTWSWYGPFGTYDRASLRRGLQVYTEVCGACHGMNLLSYRHLGAVGFSNDEIKALASDYEVEDGPNEDGDMFMRTANPADTFVDPFPNSNVARVSNGGALPPDLSLITKARPHGPDYVRALLLGYRDEAPDGRTLMDGMYWNDYYAGNQIAMAPPLVDELIEYADGTPATIEQMSNDVVTFLNWAAEPELEERKRLGLKVLLFLVVLTALLYALKRLFWARVH